ncbi:MAG: LamG domain-containing protein, partial [Bacteroidota bacterium]|nr:LamG domain-containing protein [Bacteroidota bacterium]
PVFRVAYADHSSWDMVWLRIDYNGAGFDAFVTDIGLARTRVSHYMDALPKPDQWTHIALSWDETEGIRFYINGKLVERQTVSGTVYDTGLDQFGPHSRIISPYQVQSEYNFVRGGDLDELRIYDRMLSDENIAQLSRGQVPNTIPDMRRNLNERRWRDEWWTRHGWNKPNDPPPPLSSPNVAVRKVETLDVYDVKRWYWKGNDGIRETTWPGVYNMSRLPGRYDYFVLPDWDTYSVSGQTVRFKLPDEPWNHIEMWGKAWGQLTYEKEHQYDHTFAVRHRTQIKSYHRTKETNQGGTLRFDNALREEPIGELGVYYVQTGKAPQGSSSETFTLAIAPQQLTNKALQDVAAFINGRYPADEQAKMVGVSKGTNNPSDAALLSENTLPFLHIMIPYTSHPNEGLEGVEIDLPALAVTPTHGGVFPLELRIKDPLWPMRDLADFSFSVKPNEPHTLWMDTRDRILPEGHALYLTLAGAGADLMPSMLRGARVRLIYKPKEKARPEHEADRITQVRDLYGFTVEERPTSPRLNLYNRFIADDSDLLKVNPNHFLGKAYKYALTNNVKDRPDYTLPKPPAGVPEWAFLQVEYLRQLAKIINYYIDERQISNGEFGGGLSDDDDFTNMFVGTAFMGIEPEKTRQSLRLMMSGFYNQERDPYYAPLRQPSLPLFTNGLATITTDLLHAYEEGIEAVGQLQLLDYGNPLHINHGMEVAKRILEEVTQVNAAGHRHFRSRYYGGTNMATEDPWQWSGAHSYHMLHTAYNLARYNGQPKLRKMITDIADGLLAHTDKNGTVYTDIHFSADTVRGIPGAQNTWQVFKAAYDFTGDAKYLKPISERNSEAHPFNKDSLVKRYTERIKDLSARAFINTEGSVWIDRVVAPDTDLQTDRLGGVALWRINNIYQ